MTDIKSNKPIIAAVAQDAATKFINAAEGEAKPLQPTPVPEDPGRAAVKFNLFMSPELRKHIKRYSVDVNVGMNELMVEALKHYFYEVKGIKPG